MLLTPMRYKDYIWPHNPAVYSITYERQIGRASCRERVSSCV